MQYTNIYNCINQYVLEEDEIVRSEIENNLLELISSHIKEEIENYSNIFVNKKINRIQIEVSNSYYESKKFNYDYKTSSFENIYNKLFTPKSDTFDGKSIFSLSININKDNKIDLYELKQVIRIFFNESNYYQLEEWKKLQIIYFVEDNFEYDDIFYKPKTLNQVAKLFSGNYDISSNILIQLIDSLEKELRYRKYINKSQTILDYLIENINDIDNDLTDMLRDCFGFDNDFSVSISNQEMINTINQLSNNKPLVLNSKSLISIIDNIFPSKIYGSSSKAYKQLKTFSNIQEFIKEIEYYMYPINNIKISSEDFLKVINYYKLENIRFSNKNVIAK